MLATVFYLLHLIFFSSPPFFFLPSLSVQMNALYDSILSLPLVYQSPLFKKLLVVALEFTVYSYNYLSPSSSSTIVLNIQYRILTTQYFQFLFPFLITLLSFILLIHRQQPPSYTLYQQIVRKIKFYFTLIHSILLWCSSFLYVILIIYHFLSP